MDVRVLLFFFTMLWVGMQYMILTFPGHTHLNAGLNLQLKNVNIFLPISINICFECSEEPSHLDGPFEYPQHM